MSFTVWFTGFSGAGKTTLSSAIYKEILKYGLPAELLDGDVIRSNFAQDLTYSKEHRNINVTRIGFLSKLLNKHGVVSVVAMISPYHVAREENKKNITNYIEVYCNCSVSHLKKRDPKGLYAKAVRGEIKNFTGISDEYEEPESPSLVVNTEYETVDESISKIIDYLKNNGFLVD